MSSNDKINRRNFLEFGLSIGGHDLRVYHYMYMWEATNSWNAERHSHSHYEIHIIVNGECSFEAEEKEYSLKAGDLILVRPGCYHASSKASEDFLRFSGGFQIDGDPFQELGTQGMIFSEASVETLSFCRLFQAECEKNRSFKTEMSVSMLKTIIISSWRDLFGNLPEDQDSEDTMDFENRTSVIDRYFQANYAKECGEDELAQLLHISRRQLVRVLKDNYGKSFRERLLETRMEHASWFLKNTERKICEIASQIGYESEASFYRAFKAYYKMTPTEYRNRGLNI